jgi:hypothetical protein
LPLWVKLITSTINLTLSMSRSVKTAGFFLE